MKYAFIGLWFVLMTTCTCCNTDVVPGLYQATVAFQGVDPRFYGQRYVWQLCLNEDGSFSCTFEMPLAVYRENGTELIGKGNGAIKGQWTGKCNAVLLKRRSGSGSLGSSNTIFFSFRDDRIRVSVSGGKIIFAEGDRRLEMKRVSEGELKK